MIFDGDVLVVELRCNCHLFLRLMRRQVFFSFMTFGIQAMQSDLNGCTPAFKAFTYLAITTRSFNKLSLSP